MKELLTVSTPKPIETIFDNLFLQVAAKHGCGDHLYIQKNRRSVACNAGCANCKAKEILKDFEKHQAALAKKSSALYSEHVVENEIWAPEDPLLASETYTNVLQIAKGL